MRGLSSALFSKYQFRHFHFPHANKGAYTKVGKAGNMLEKNSSEN
jgi:hypothetical protein